ncbi:MAG TPA: hypothetical protein VL503_04015 [Candidatus Omnitrophota bacterium]|jgi:hypothetical protein|nr:hypothetical protein [Candidatus Omnitrophota bacterium]
MIVLAQVCLALAVALFVLSPLWFYRGQRSHIEAADASVRRSIAEKKGRLYSQLLDLDFDKDSGKISPEDHARMREETMNEVLAVLAEEDRLGGPRRGLKPTVIEGGDRVERMIEEYKRARPAAIEVNRS